MKLNVAFFFGGKSVEHEVSVISGQQAMAAADSEKYNVIPVYIAKNGYLYTGEAMKNIEEFKNMPALLKKSSRIILVNDEKGVKMEKYPKPVFGGDLGFIDVAVPVVHGTNGEDGTLQGYLDMLGLAYAGCNVLSSALGMDKIVMKNVLASHGIPVLECEYFYSREWFDAKDEIIEKTEKLGYPLIVKPANLGSSVGISKAENRAQLEEAVEAAANYSERVLVERAIINLREINCAVLGDEDGVVTSVCEEPLNARDILGYDEKYKAGSKGGAKGMASLARKVPAEIDEKTEQTIKEYVSRAFGALCCSGVARVDCMIDDDDGAIYINEINTIPGSLAFYLWKEAGMEFGELIDALVKQALKRRRKRDNLVFSYDTNLLEMQGGCKGAKN